MVPDERRNLYLRAFYAWGADAQVDMVVEEVGELLTAIGHAKRGRATSADVAGEIADVSIMLEQLALMLRVENDVNKFIVQKTARLAERLNAYDARQREKRGEG